MQFWIVVQDKKYPTCTLNDVYVPRKVGWWEAGAQLETQVSIWPTQSDFDAASCGATKYLHVISGGKDNTTAKTWWQQEAIKFTKVCN